MSKWLYREERLECLKERNSQTNNRLEQLKWIEKQEKIKSILDEIKTNTKNEVNNILSNN